MRLLVAVVTAVLVWHSVLQLLFMVGGAEDVSLSIATVVALAAGVVAYRQGCRGGSVGD
jgi:hypothetical protein